MNVVPISDHPPEQDDFERHELPDGTVVWYRDPDHSYWSEVKWRKSTSGRTKGHFGWGGSGRLTGISTVAKPADFNPDGLMGWVEKLDHLGFARAFGWRDGKPTRPVPSDPYELRQVLDSLGLRWEQIRDARGEIGTNVHKAVLYALASGEDPPDLGSLPAEQQGYGQGVLAWWHDRKPKPHQAEQVVADLSLGVAGRFDLRAEIGCGDRELGSAPNRVQGVLAPETWTVDAKTGKYEAAKEHVQLTGYGHCQQVSGVGSSDRLVILRVCEDGSYFETEVEPDVDWFVHCIEVYRRTGKVKNAAAKRRRVREAVAA